MNLFPSRLTITTDFSMETPTAILHISLENEERVHEVVGPPPDLFPHSHAEVVARIECTHVVQEFCTTSAKLC